MRGRRAMAGLALVGAVMVLHGLVYSWLDAPSHASPSRMRPDSWPAVQARVQAARPERAAVPTPAGPPSPMKPRHRPAAVAPPRSPVAAAAGEGPSARASARAGAHAETDAQTESASLPPSPPPPLPPPPVYATRLPPSARLDYQARRGAQVLGQAQLDWWQDGRRYRLSLLSPGAAGADPALRVLTSVGRVGVHGLQPERFVDRRAHRGARAVSLQCDVGGVSFSASTAQRDCVPGMQDNLSWWLQLSAIVAALPQAPAPGATFSAAVARTHGTVDRWTFEVVAPSGQDAALAASALAASTIRLVRRPDRAARFDIGAEVWLDAAPPHWPLRVALQPARGEPLVWTRLPPQGVN